MVEKHEVFFRYPMYITFHVVDSPSIWIGVACFQSSFQSIKLIAFLGKNETGTVKELRAATKLRFFRPNYFSACFLQVFNYIDLIARPNFEVPRLMRAFKYRLVLDSATVGSHR